MIPILLKEKGQLPEGTLVRVLDVPEPKHPNNGWHMYKDQIVGLEGKVVGHTIDWGRELFLKGGGNQTNWQYHSSTFDIEDHHFIIGRLDDPDGNY